MKQSFAAEIKQGVSSGSKEYEEFKTAQDLNEEILKAF